MLRGSIGLSAGTREIAGQKVVVLIFFFFGITPSQPELENKPPFKSSSRGSWRSGKSLATLKPTEQGVHPSHLAEAFRAQTTMVGQ